MDQLVQDVRYALRNLRKRQGFFVVAILSLALGVGANTAVFSVVHAILLNPLPFPHADRLVVLWEANPAIGVHRAGPSGATFMDWRDRARTFEDMALFQPGSATITGFGEPEQVPAMRVTVNLPAMLGAEFALGRSFRAEEGHGGRHNVVILSYGYWQRRFGGDPDVLGREFTGDGIPYQVIGVLAESFWFPVGSDLLVPWDSSELQEMPRDRREHAAMGLLAPGVELDSARAEMDAIASQLVREQEAQRGWGVDIVPATEGMAEHLRPALLVLLGAVGFVLLIACLNIANLLLARGSARERELAIRAAAGASRGRLLRQFLTESMVLAVAGGTAGLAFGVWSLELLTTLLPSRVPIPDASGHLLLPDVAVNGTVLAAASLVAIVCGIAFGVAPALQMRGIDLNRALKASGRGGGKRSARTRRLVVATEVAFAMILLTATFLMVISFSNMKGVDLGFRSARVLTLQLEVPIDSKYQDRRDRAEFYRQILERLRTIPGIDEVGVSEILPLDDELRRRQFRFERHLDADNEALWADYNIADEGFFEVLEIPLIRGRMFDETDGLDRSSVVLVDTTFAERFMANRDPIGEHILVPSPREIVGIVGPIRSAGIDRRPEPTMYFPYLQAPDDRMSFLVRTQRDRIDDGLVGAIKEAVWSVDRDQPVYDIRAMDDVVVRSTETPRLTLTLLALFGAVALSMASIGIYGVMSYAVSQRHHEIGLRQALGATRGDVRRMVAGDATMVGLLGVGAGAIGSIVAARFLSSLLYGVNATDPVALLVVALLLLAVSAGAAYIPARRAAAVDPVVALRCE